MWRNLLLEDPNVAELLFSTNNGGIRSFITVAELVFLRGGRVG